MNRRRFLAQAAVATASSSLSSARPLLAAGRRGRPPRILVRSSWQTVNIGDIGHTPGLLRLLEDHLPEAEVRLWPSSVNAGVRELLQKRFPKLTLVEGEPAIKTALDECDFLLHGSGPSFVAERDVSRWHQQTGKPFGVYGITLTDPAEPTLELLSTARFVFFRDTVSLQIARKAGCDSPVMEFGPDAAFAVDVRDDATATAFLSQHRARSRPLPLRHPPLPIHSLLEDQAQPRSRPRQGRPQPGAEGTRPCALRDGHHRRRPRDASQDPDLP